MARTDIDTVRSIYSAHEDGTLHDDEAVTFWIDAAHDMVSDRLGDRVSRVSADQLETLEALVACHLLGAGDPQESEGGMGDSSSRFEGANSEGEGLRATRFGRRAIQLDPTGRLSQAGQEPSTFETYGPASSGRRRRGPGDR